MEILAVKHMQKQIKSLSRHIKGIYTDEDIEKVSSAVVAAVAKQTGGTLRG